MFINVLPRTLFPKEYGPSFTSSPIGAMYRPVHVTLYFFAHITSLLTEISVVVYVA